MVETVRLFSVVCAQHFRRRFVNTDDAVSENEQCAPEYSGPGSIVITRNRSVWPFDAQSLISAERPRHGKVVVGDNSETGSGAGPSKVFSSCEVRYRMRGKLRVTRVTSGRSKPRARCNHAVEMMAAALSRCLDEVRSQRLMREMTILRRLS